MDFAQRRRLAGQEGALALRPMITAKTASLQQTLGVVLLVTAFVFQQLLVATVPFAFPALLTAGTVALLMTFNGRRFVLRTYMPARVFVVVCAFFVVLLVDLGVGQMHWTSNQTTSVLLLPIVAAILMRFTPPATLHRTLLVCVLVVLGMAAYEFATGAYLYVVTVRVQGELTELNETLMSGGRDIFRVKSAFAGPLTLSGFCVFSAVLLRRSTTAVILCFATAILSTSRTGILLTALMLILAVLGTTERGRLFRSVLALGALIVGISYLLLGSSGLGERALAVFDFSGEESTNVARMYFWQEGLAQLSQYSMLELLFGNNGQYTARVGNSAESGWLFLALNHGILVLTAHFAMIWYLVRRMGRLAQAYAGLLLVGNSVVTMSFGLIGGLLFWMAIFSLGLERRVARDRFRDAGREQHLAQMQRGQEQAPLPAVRP